ncbi:MAG: right-handed parallel beta-helix repeat-containing protein [Bacteroidota bacterium]
MYFSLTRFFPVVLLACISAGLLATEYHVAKTGNDDNDGSAVAPFLTIGKAAGLVQPGDVVVIHEGTYEEMIRPTTSGTADAPIVFRSFEQDVVIVTAMQALTGFTQDTRQVYKKTVDWDLGQENFVMNGSTAMDIARWPNNTDGDPFTIDSRRNVGGSGGDVPTNAFLTDPSIPNIDWTDGAIFFYGDRPGAGWLAWKSVIKSSSQGRVNFDVIKNQNWILSFHPPADKGDYYLEGVRGALDYENEWWFDEDDRTLYVQLPDGAAPEDGQVQMRRRRLVVDLNNRSHIHLENFAVFGGKVEIEGTGNRLFGMSSFYGSFTRGINPNFHVDNRAIDVKWNAQDTRIEQCEIGFGAGSGLWDSGANTIIENNYLHDFNFLAAYDGPLMVRGRQNALVLRNTIRRGGRDGIQIITPGSRVAYNDISRSNLIADDCGLFYTVDHDRNIEVDHNWLHDAEGRGNLRKAAGIYLDSGPGNFKVHHNVIYNTEWTSIQINREAINIEIYNNTLWDAGDGAFGSFHPPGEDFSNVKIYNNLQNNNILAREEQADYQNNLILPENANPFVDESVFNFMPQEGSDAVDFGQEIPGFTDGFLGAAPDAGAYERGGELWIAGVDWDINRGPASRCYDLPGENCSKFPVSTNDPVFYPTKVLQVFPNPTAGRLYFEELEPNTTLRVYNAAGQLLLQQSMLGQDVNAGLDVSQLTPGLYVVTDAFGGVARFVKQ